MIEPKKFSGIGLKLIFIALVFVALLIGLFFMNAKLSDREYTYNDAVEEISESAGNFFSLEGPYIIIPVIRTWYTEHSVGETTVREKNQTKEYVTVYAEKANLDANIKTQERTLGIYSSPVYTGTLDISASFIVPYESNEEYEYLFDQAELILDTRQKNLCAHPVFNLNGIETVSDAMQAESKEPSYTVIGSTCTVSSGKNIFSTRIELKGARSFWIRPVSKETKLSVTSDWASPGFTGFDYLPDTREISSDGFTAQWNIPFADTSAQLGFRLVQPVDLYKQLDRAFNYGFLFILVPFIVMFLFEIFADIVLHPVHYLLCGAATVIFFLLLLALSEHLPFVASYLIAAFASALLTSIYLASVTGKFKIGASMILLFSVLYAYLYLSLKSEDYAFLIGTLFAFCVLASVMFLTRKVNWSSLHGSEVKAKAKE